jgi:allantoicase
LMGMVAIVPPGEYRDAGCWKDALEPWREAVSGHDTTFCQA